MVSRASCADTLFYTYRVLVWVENDSNKTEIHSWPVVGYLTKSLGLYSKIFYQLTWWARTRILREYFKRQKSVIKSACYLKRDSHSLLLNLVNLHGGSKQWAHRILLYTWATGNWYKYIFITPSLIHGGKMKSWLKSCKRSFETKNRTSSSYIHNAKWAIYAIHTRQTPTMMVWIIIWVIDTCMHVTHNVRISKTLPPKSTKLFRKWPMRNGNSCTRVY